MVWPGKNVLALVHGYRGRLTVGKTEPLFSINGHISIIVRRSQPSVEGQAVGHDSFKPFYCTGWQPLAHRDGAGRYRHLECRWLAFQSYSFLVHLTWYAPSILRSPVLVDRLGIFEQRLCYDSDSEA